MRVPGYARIASLIVILALSGVAQVPKRVLALYWYGRDFPSNDQFDQALQVAFRSSAARPVEYYAEYLESNRFPGENLPLALRDYLKRKYSDRNIDVLIAMSPVSLEFLVEHRKQLLPNTPIVFYASRLVELGDQKIAMTGVTMRANRQRDTLQAALTLHPGTRHVFIIYGKGAGQSAEGWRQNLAELDGQLKDFEGRVSFTYLTNVPLYELTASVKSLPEQSIILYIRHSEDAPGPVLNTRECLELIAQSAAVPIYSASSDHLGAGIVGGYFVDIEAGAAKTAEIALRVADGAQPQEIPVVELQSGPMFDWRELRRWRISEAKLPPDSVIRFREITFWDRYKWRVLAVVAFCLLQTVLIAKLLIERRTRRKASDSLVILNSELQDRMAEITALSSRLISAQEDERRRIAMELHDDLSQQVAALGIRLSMIKRKLPNTGPARDAFATVEGGLTHLENSIHALSHELHPALLEHAGLVPALRAHCEEFEAVNGINAHLSVDGGRNVPLDLALCLYRVTQESLRNVAKHSGAKEAWISLTEANGLINLTIEDAGRGLDPQKASSNGIGLVSMKERVRAVGGSLEFGSRPGGGAVTRVLVSMSRGLAASG